MHFFWLSSVTRIRGIVKLLTLFHSFEYSANTAKNVLRKPLHYSSHDNRTIIFKNL